MIFCYTLTIKYGWDGYRGKKVSAHLIRRAMNKRQKKKKEKKEAWDAEFRRLKNDREINYNGEGYRDDTAGQALRNLIRKGY